MSIVTRERRHRAAAAGAVLFFLLNGCARTPTGSEGSQPSGLDGRKVFLQSEGVLDKENSFRATIETYMLGTTQTEAEYDCDHRVFRYVESNDRLNRQIEYIQTDTIRFSRQISEPSTNWSSVNEAPFSGVCQRLSHGGDESGLAPARVFSADQGRILPPFFYYANKPDVSITMIGNEGIDDVNCEIWRVYERTSDYPLHTIWIGSEDRLPRKYVEGDPDQPQGVVMYSDYGADLHIDVPENSSGN